MSTDRAAEVAEYLAGAVGVSFTTMDAEVARRWPGLTERERQRAAEIAVEILEADAASLEAEARSLEALAALRRAAS